MYQYPQENITYCLPSFQVAIPICFIQNLLLNGGNEQVWRNCLDDYINPISVWRARAPEGYVSPGCIAVASFEEPEPNAVHCVVESLTEETEFEEQKVWSSPDSYPWACHIYQVKSDALHFVALRQSKEESDCKPTRILDNARPVLDSLKAQSSMSSC